ncbi:C4-dicarboxylate transporter DctA [Compostibacter hankyongensis]|uniref:Dicarboxylate/amino acid:cation symporter n=1 Tax=Compostibacter hankyongensis TaxID=1007089 RepID=A0ABP8FGC2_9BACT
MRLLRNLTFQVICAIILGVAIGICAPQAAVKLKPAGDVFINMIRMLIAPIIFLTIVLGIGRMESLKKVGRVGGKAILYFELVTTFALLIAVVLANLIKPGRGISADRIQLPDIRQYADQAAHMNWVDFFLHIVPENFIEAFAKGDILQILFFSILFGVALSKMGKWKEGLIQTFERLSGVFFIMLRFIMKLAPLGALGGMAYTIGKFGWEALLPMGKLMISVYSTMLIFIFVVLNLLLRYYRVSLWKFLGYIREELLLVLGTSSSESVLPQIMEKLEHMGCAKPVVGLVVPTGYSFNLDGTTIYMAMSTIFLAQVFHIHLSISHQLSIILILMLTSKGAAGVTGSGFIVLASTLAATKVIPVEGMAVLLGVDRFMSESRALTNIIGNGVATIFIANNEKAFDRQKMEEAFNRHATGRGSAGDEPG